MNAPFLPPPSARAGHRRAGRGIFRIENRKPGSENCPRAFSLIELLIVIAVIAIMASLVISAFSNASMDARGVLARQQQAAVQGAVNAWIARQSAPPRSLADAQTAFAAATTSKARLDLVQSYLDDATYAELADASRTTDAAIKSDAMVKIGRHLEISAWTSGSYPKVNLEVTP